MSTSSFSLDDIYNHILQNPKALLNEHCRNRHFDEKINLRRIQDIFKKFPADKNWDRGYISENAAINAIQDNAERIAYEAYTLLTTPNRKTYTFSIIAAQQTPPNDCYFLHVNHNNKAIRKISCNAIHIVLKKTGNPKQPVEIYTMYPAAFSMTKEPSMSAILQDMQADLSQQILSTPTITKHFANADYVLRYLAITSQPAYNNIDIKAYVKPIDKNQYMWWKLPVCEHNNQTFHLETNGVNNIIYRFNPPKNPPLSWDEMVEQFNQQLPLQIEVIKQTGIDIDTPPEPKTPVAEIEVPETYRIKNDIPGLEL